MPFANRFQMGREERRPESEETTQNKESGECADKFRPQTSHINYS